MKTLISTFFIIITGSIHLLVDYQFPRVSSAQWLVLFRHYHGLLDIFIIDNASFDMYVFIIITGSIPPLVDYQFPHGIIRLVVSVVSALTWQIHVLLKITVLNNTIIIKTQVFWTGDLSQFCHLVNALWVILLPKRIKLFSFPIF